jgi:hypothetical protein
MIRRMISMRLGEWWPNSVRSTQRGAHIGQRLGRKIFATGSRSSPGRKHAPRHRGSQQHATLAFALLTSRASSDLGVSRSASQVGRPIFTTATLKLLPTRPEPLVTNWRQLGRVTTTAVRCGEHLALSKLLCCPKSGCVRAHALLSCVSLLIGRTATFWSALETSGHRGRPEVIAAGANRRE